MNKTTSVLHLHIEERLTDKEVLKDFINFCAEQGVVYFAINYCLNECEKGHISVGNIDKCPVCSAPIETKYTRVVGFLTATRMWNKTRRENDFPNRVFYGTNKLNAEL